MVLPAPLNISEQSALGKRDGLAAGDDDVIEHADIDQRQRLAQPPGDEFVCLAWLCRTRWMLGFIRECQQGSLVHC